MANNDWWTSPTESEDGKLVLVTGRRDVDKFRNNPKFNIRIEITWKYANEENGMPDDETAATMEKVTEAFQSVFTKDPIAVMTGIYTGDGQRNWIFYTLSTNIFGKKINEALSDFEVLPIEIYAENDPGWEEYAEMRDMTEVVADDDL